MSDLRCMKVGELTAHIKEALESSFHSVKVEGEVSNFRPSSTGHYYFSLKDSNAMISAVMFKYAIKSTTYIPQDGELVQVTGDVSVYSQRGSYQIVCHSIEKAGEGEILAQLEKLKQQLAAEGLFDADRKKPLPKMVEKVGVVTSPTGAAIKDILRVLKNRNNNINLVILPAPVQGSEAASIIAARIRQANTFKIAQVLIVGRGGGSLEDLLPFSSEEVVRAIAESEIPVISAVGHEIDFALSDFAADYRAPTPSAAAEAVSMESSRIIENISTYKNNIISAIERKIEDLKERLLDVSPENIAELLRGQSGFLFQRIDNSRYTITRTMKEQIKITKIRLELFESKIKGASPEIILKKGYATVFKQSKGNIKQIKSAFDVKTGEELEIRFYSDILTAQAKAGKKIESQGEENER